MDPIEKAVVWFLWANTFVLSCLGVFLLWRL